MTTTGTGVVSGGPDTESAEEATKYGDHGRAAFILVFDGDGSVVSGHLGLESRPVGETSGTLSYEEHASEQDAPWDDDPYVLQLYTTYQRRWVGRYWQESGIKIIPHVAVGREEYMFGLPKGLPTVLLNFQNLEGKHYRALALQTVKELCDRFEVQSLITYGEPNPNPDLLHAAGGVPVHGIPTWKNLFFIYNENHKELERGRISRGQESSRRKEIKNRMKGKKVGIKKGPRSLTPKKPVKSKETQAV